jgi:hypothetical protein
MPPVYEESQPLVCWPDPLPPKGPVMPPTIHDLKTWPPLFFEAAQGRMNFQIRRDDRGFAVGDHLRLREWDPETEEYSGRECERRVVSIFHSNQLLAGENRAVIAEGFVVLGVVPVPYGQSQLVDQRPEHVRSVA